MFIINTNKSILYSSILFKNYFYINLIRVSHKINFQSHKIRKILDLY